MSKLTEVLEILAPTINSVASTIVTTLKQVLSIFLCLVAITAFVALVCYGAHYFCMAADGIQNEMVRFGMQSIIVLFAGSCLITLLFKLADYS